MARPAIKKKSWGFTIIELLVSVAVGGLLVGGGIAAFKGIGTKQTLKQAGKSFENNLRAVQQKAQAGQIPSGCIGFTGYKLKYISNNSYGVEVVCNTASTIGSYELPEKVFFENPFSDVNFYALRSDLIGYQTISLTSEGHSYRVIVEQSGVIKGGLE